MCDLRLCFIVAELLEETCPISEHFLSSDDFAERARDLYNAGCYGEAIDLLRDALTSYPSSADLHIGMAYARLAQEEYAWARQSFEEALALDSNQEEALAGLGETLLKLGEHAKALQCFDTIIALGYRDDHDLILQVGRSLFREGMFDNARGFFEIVGTGHPDSAEAAACLGYTAHRIGDQDAALRWLRRALELDPNHVEARIYLGNTLYDCGEYESALFHFRRTEPEEHTDELALWRVIELKKSIHELSTDDPEVKPWVDQIRALSAERDTVDRLLAEVAAHQPDGSFKDPRQLDLFGTLLTELQGMNRRSASETHLVRTKDGVIYAGTWEEIVRQMRSDDSDFSGDSVEDYMQHVSQRSLAEKGIVIPATDAELFVRGIAAAGLVTIVG